MHRDHRAQRQLDCKQCMIENEVISSSQPECFLTVLKWQTMLHVSTLSSLMITC